MEYTTKHEDSSVLTKEDGTALTKPHEDANTLMNSTPGPKAFSITQLFDYRAYWTTTADKYTHWKKSIQQTMTKDDNVLHTSREAFSTKHEDVKNALMNSKHWKAFSSTKMFDYQAYWTTLADKYTHWERGIQQTMTKDDNVLNKSSSRWNQSKNLRWSMIVTLLLLIISEHDGVFLSTISLTSFILPLFQAYSSRSGTAHLHMLWGISTTHANLPKSSSHGRSRHSVPNGLGFSEAQAQ